MACSATACGVDAGGVGEADAVRAEHVLVVLVDAGADRLDELEPLGLRHQLVLPHHRDDHHVGLRQLRGVARRALRTWKWAMPVSRAANRSAMR